MDREHYQRVQFKGDKSEDLFYQTLSKYSCGWMAYGYENNKFTQGFNEKIKTGEYPHILIQHKPDIAFFVGSKLFLAEVKGGAAIKRDSYKACRAYTSLGFAVIIVHSTDDGVKICPIERLTFSEPKYYKYPNIPILDKFWIAPRLFTDKWTNGDYAKWKSDNQYASGTTFAFMDFENSYWITFDNFIIDTDLSYHRDIDQKRFIEQKNKE